MQNSKPGTKWINMSCTKIHRGNVQIRAVRRERHKFVGTPNVIPQCTKRAKLGRDATKDAPGPEGTWRRFLRFSLFTGLVSLKQRKGNRVLVLLCGRFLKKHRTQSLHAAEQIQGNQEQESSLNTSFERVPVVFASLLSPLPFIASWIYVPVQD